VTITASSFRTDLPEFANTTTYPDSMVNFWLGVAANWIDPAIWSTMADFGTELFVAHFISGGAVNIATAAAGGVVGATQGIMSSKGVGPVSVGYDVGAITMADAGQWNATKYGIQFYQLSRMFGSGGMQL